MKTPKSRLRTDRDFRLALTEGLRKQSARPNVYGYKPHDRQVVFHASEAKKKLFIGGNRSGKTVGGAVESVWWLTGKHPYIQTPRPPVRGRCISVDLLHGVEQIVKPEIARWIPPSELQQGSWEVSYDKELRTLTLENGSTLEFMSYEQTTEKFAGTSRHFVWFDEEPPRDIYIENLLRLIDTGGSFWITMTPVDGMSSWVYDELYIKAKETDEVFAIEVDMKDNPHLNQGEAQLILAGLNKEEIEAREHGRFIQIGGLIYKMFSASKHVIDPLIPPEDWLHVAGMDHGFNNPTAWLWAAVNPDGRIVVYDEYYKSGEIVRVHAGEVHRIDKEHKREPDYYVGDPSIRNVDPITGTSVLIEYMDYGVPILLGNNDVKAGLNRIARYLTGVNEVPQLLITKNCTNLIREISRLRWATWTAKKVRADRNPKEEQHKKDDHACIDDRTQILTEKGWYLFKNLPRDVKVATRDSEGFLEWQQPYEYIEYDYNGVMYWYTNNAYSFCVTPDHNMVVGTHRQIQVNKSNKFDNIPVSELTQKVYYMPSKAFPGLDDGEYWDKYDSYILGIYLAEGSKYIHNGKKCVLIANTDYDVLNTVKARLKKGSIGVNRFEIHDNYLYDVLPAGKSYEKRIPRDFLELASCEDLEECYKGMMDGDGCYSTSRYTTTSIGLANDFQELLIRIGKRGRICLRKDLTIVGRKVYDVYIISGKRNNNELRVSDIKKKQYNGKVYCVSVSNRTICIRRNGRVMWIGNCDALRYLVASRPDNDHSVTVMPKKGPMGASVAIDPTGRIDEDLLSGQDRTRSLDYASVDDFFLGGEF